LHSDHTLIAVAYEAGRDGFWLARWLMARDLEAHVAGRRRIGPAGHALGETNATTMMIAEKPADLIRGSACSRSMREPKQTVGGPQWRA
jgi:hypothetical protein